MRVCVGMEKRDLGFALCVCVCVCWERARRGHVGKKCVLELVIVG